MMKKYSNGGMPSMEESRKSGDRAEKMNRDEMLRMGVGPKPKKKPMPATRSTLPSLSETMKSVRRLPKEPTPKQMRDMEESSKVRKYAKGGSVSKRADGIAKKGKTKGKMV
jgi:hypothetical protein